MAKSIKNPSPAGKKSEPGAGQHFEDYKLMQVKGFAAQNKFAPTPAEPVRMRFKMAGGC